MERQQLADLNIALPRLLIATRSTLLRAGSYLIAMTMVRVVGWKDRLV